MKEFTFYLHDFAGLRSAEGVQLNTSGLAGAINFRMEQGSVSALHPPSLFGKLPEFSSFPFPQLGVVDGEPLIFDRGAVYELSSSWRPQLCIGGLVESGYPWSWGWMPGFGLFTNFRVILEWVKGVWTQHSRDTVPQCRALACYNGQFLAGNTVAYGEHLENRVMWAKPGTIDFRIDESNEAGSLIVKGVGCILAMGAAPGGIVVYGSEGVALLSPQPHPVWYGQRLLTEDGVAGQLAWCGDEESQFFVSKSGYLYEVRVNGTLDIKGYHHWLGPAAKQEMVLSYDCVRKEVYIIG